jgi:methyl-accepting chemotaxis protein
MSGLDIERRMAFIGLSHPSPAYTAVGTVIQTALPGALDTFYAQVRRFPETVAFFRDESHIGAAKSAQIRHWNAIAAGRADAEYAASVLAIGGVHARIGLEPRWYVGGYSVVLAELSRAIIERPRPFLRSAKRHAAETAAAIAELNQRVMLDVELAISVYLEVLQAERDKARAIQLEAESRQAEVVAALGAAMKSLAEGDLSVTIDQAFAPDYQPLKDDFHAATEALRSAVQAVADSVSGLSTGSGELASASDDLAMRTERQAAGLERTVAATAEIAEAVELTAADAQKTAEAISAARRDVGDGAEVVGQAVKAMHAIAESSAEIERFAALIDEIALQTNLLALNAGVEAARAGDMGRGFAVVAQEVRALAHRSADASKEIRALINTSASQVAKGVDLVGRAGAALERIGGQVAAVDDLAENIVVSAKQQAEGLGRVRRTMGDMDEITQQNAAMTEEATAATRQLANEAGVLANQVRRFRLERLPSSATSRLALVA